MRTFRCAQAEIVCYVLLLSTPSDPPDLIADGKRFRCFRLLYWENDTEIHTLRDLMGRCEVASFLGGKWCLGGGIEEVLREVMRREKSN